MANKNFFSFDAISGLASDDVLLVGDTSANQVKKATALDLVGGWQDVTNQFTKAESVTTTAVIFRYHPLLKLVHVCGDLKSTLISGDNTLFTWTDTTYNSKQFYSQLTAYSNNEMGRPSMVKGRNKIIFASANAHSSVETIYITGFWYTGA